MKLFKRIIGRIIHDYKKIEKKFLRWRREKNEGIFYSQFLEDYILSILFRHIDKGCYVDVGANSPNLCSVTKYFYEKGWRGINIEPIQSHYFDYLKYRPEDINLNIGISQTEGELVLSVITFNDNPDGLSSFDPHTLQEAIEDGCTYRKVNVPVKPLNQVLTEYPMENINFLKIDVEGLEEDVLKSIDLSIYRPWVIVVEGIGRKSYTVRYNSKWDYILKQNNYFEMLFDGVNFYYVSKEYHSQLESHFKEAFEKAVSVNRKYKVVESELQYFGEV